MGAVQRCGAHTDPRIVGGQVEPATLARHLPGLRLLVGQQQRLVRGVEIDPVEVVHLHPGQGLHETHRVADRVHHLLVLPGQRRTAHPAQVPVLGMVQVGEAAIDQRAHEVHGQRRTGVRGQHPLRVRLSGRGGEFRAIDHVAAITWQADAIAGFGVGRTRLGVLPGEAAHPYHRQAQAVDQDQAHLQQHLEPVGNRARLAVAEVLRAITALQQEAPALLGLGQLPLQFQDLPGRHQWRQPAQFDQCRFQRLGIGITWHLQGRPVAPARRRPGSSRIDRLQFGFGGAHGGGQDQGGRRTKTLRDGHGPCAGATRPAGPRPPATGNRSGSRPACPGPARSSRRHRSCRNRSGPCAPRPVRPWSGA